MEAVHGRTLRTRPTSKTIFTPGTLTDASNASSWTSTASHNRAVCRSACGRSLMLDEHVRHGVVEASVGVHETHGGGVGVAHIDAAPYKVKASALGGPF